MKKSYLLLHIAVLLAGFTGIFGKLITLNEGLIAWYRVFFSCLWLFLILKIYRINTKISIYEKYAIAKTGIFITMHWVFFYGSIRYSNISIGVVCYSLTSFFTAIFKPLMKKKSIVKSELFISLLTLFGIGLIFTFEGSYKLGIGLGVISSAFAALFTIGNESLVNEYDTMLINFYQMLGGTFFLGAFMPAYLYYSPHDRIFPNGADTLYLIILSLVCTVLLYLLFAESLKHIPAFTVNLSFNLEPVYAIVLAFLFFHETKEVGIYFYIGLLFIALSIILQTKISIREGNGKTNLAN